MKLDYDLLKQILEHIEVVGNGQERQTIANRTFSALPIRCGSFDILVYHFDILIENGFVDGKVIRVPFRGHKVATSVDYFDLTLNGHRLLESMRHQTLWGRIKSQAETLGVAGLKQIPALAIAMLSGDAV